MTVEDADGASSFRFFRQKTEKVIEQPFVLQKCREFIRKKFVFSENCRCIPGGVGVYCKWSKVE